MDARANPYGSLVPPQRPATPYPPPRPGGSGPYPTVDAATGRQGYGQVPQGYGQSPSTKYAYSYESARDLISSQLGPRAVRAFATEGLHPGAYAIGDHGSSFGPFQAHLGGIAPGANARPGLGDEMAKSGIDVRDPASFPAQVAWLKAHPQYLNAKTFHGFKNIKGDVGDIGNRGTGGSTGAGASFGGASGATPYGSVSRANLFSGNNWKGPAFDPSAMVPISAGGKTAQVNKWAAPHFQGFLNDLAARGYTFDNLGGYNPRDKRGGGGKSEHAFGNAIDINGEASPGKLGPRNSYGGSTTDLPADVSAIAARHGLVWGGDWHGKKDFMHFEWSGRDVAETGGSTGSVAGGGATPGGSTSQPGASDTDKAIAAAEQRLASMDNAEKSPSLGQRIGKAAQAFAKNAPKAGAIGGEEQSYDDAGLASGNAAREQTNAAAQDASVRANQAAAEKFGIPRIESEEQLGSLKPGNLFIGPDGGLGLRPRLRRRGRKCRISKKPDAGLLSIDQPGRRRGFGRRRVGTPYVLALGSCLSREG